MKRVLLIVIDGCTSRVLGPALDAGELPLLSALAARGSLDLDCVTIFPSITPAATASIITGRYPAEHGIAGMSWWNPATNDVAYFGDDVATIFQRGAGDFVRGFLRRLNGERLLAPTLFELTERQGRRAACFNYLIFRGDTPHVVSLPLLLRMLPSVPSDVTVDGPSWLCLGDFVHDSDGRDRDASGGVRHRFGLDDEGTTACLRQLPSAAALPDFTTAYFADYDFDSHDLGPAGALKTLQRVDQQLGEVFNGWGGLDRVLEDLCVVITADHSHSEIGEGSSAGIDLLDVLHGYRCGDPATGWREADELLICPNMRAAEIYVSDGGHDATRRVVSALLEDPRIDHVIWRDEAPNGEPLHVTTKDRGTLRFRPANGGDAGLRDEHGGCWHVVGDPDALDLTIEGGHVGYGVYPNALERVKQGVDHPRSGRLWVTARPGSEFRVNGQRVHQNGGSHGTLHALDSIVPLLVAGAPDGVRPPSPARVVDVAPLCAQVLGLSFS